MDTRSKPPPLEMWAGLECTVNRVRDRYFDQVRRTGHEERIEDLDRIAALGVRRVRYPVVWERTAPEGLARADWRWPDARLARLRELGIAPIAGLVHHGSGPRGTSLLDPAFPTLLAEYAGAVAARYPWIDAYTPVNEPLTTARFSGMYGCWYPHGGDAETFIRCLLVEVRAIGEAMRAIRAINPGARLVMTEDLGYTRSTPLLAYQAEHENERRWLSLDLLCGRVGPQHPLWAWLRTSGATERELNELSAEPCPPDLIGLNYYVTSERYLDHDHAAWPGETVGGNGRHRYADVAAARSCGMVGIEPLLRAAWERFRIPLAITEAHLGCTREEQLRWLVEIHDAAVRSVAAGVPVKAVTVWSLFGAYDWASLVTRDEGRYEPGVFDVRGPEPRPTALAGAVRALAEGRRPDHPAIAGTPWWKRSAGSNSKVA